MVLVLWGGLRIEVVLLVIWYCTSLGVTGLANTRLSFYFFMSIVEGGFWDFWVSEGRRIPSACK